MCLYQPPGLARGVSLPRSDCSGDAIPTGSDGQDLEVGEVLPGGDPALQERDVVALHHLERAA
jgi:hypothetical protein